MRYANSSPPSSDAYRGILELTTWVTPLLVFANVVVFAAMAVKFNSVNGFSPAQLALWGGNSGTMDLSGQWWRLLAYQFLHINLLHLVVNMWVLWIVGRLTERLFGSVTLLLLYLTTGTIAGLASLMWNPYLVAVGASGAIFGIVGALVVFLIRGRNEVPISLTRHVPPVLLFVGFNLVSGAFTPGVDNAAHVGGLFAGLCLGAIVMRPLEERDRISMLQGFTALLFTTVCAVFSLWYLGALDHRPTVLQEFARTHSWYISRETTNLQLWQSLALQAASGAISGDQLAGQFENNIIPFWRDASTRLRQEAKSRGGNPFVPILADFATFRFRWATAVVALARENTQQNVEDTLNFARETNLAQARLDRFELHAGMDNLPLPLVRNSWVVRLINALPGHGWRCVDPPTTVEKPLSSDDSASDGPSQRQAAGCEAQRMFTDGDYAALRNALEGDAKSLANLPDGSSRLEGMWNGLSDLFSYGTIPAEETLQRTGEWRRIANDSVEPELVEALVFREWAYAARGHGYISSVSPQALQLFLIRTEMAAANLREITTRAAGNPLWYELSIAVARDQSVPATQQRAIFEKGVAKFPSYLPLYRQMLISLMPRWGGSADDVNAFIVDESKRAGHGQIDPAVYARLYLIYGYLEGGDYNVIMDADANVKTMTTGLEELRWRYPASDYILNAAARMHCIDNLYLPYRAIQSQLASHRSSIAWPDKLSVERCNKWSS